MDKVKFIGGRTSEEVALLLRSPPILPVVFKFLFITDAISINFFTARPYPTFYPGGIATSRGDGRGLHRRVE